MQKDCRSNYDRITKPKTNPPRCNNSMWTQAEELEAIRERLQKLEDAIDCGFLIWNPDVEEAEEDAKL